MFKELFTNPDFQPDMLKIYPTVVTKNSELYEIWKKREYKALTDKQFEKLIIKIKNEAIVPYVRIQRLIRDVPLPSIEAGPTVSNLRQNIEKETDCPCIRCREVKGEYNMKDLPAMLSDLKKINSHSLLKSSNKINKNGIAMQAGKIILDRIDYDASNGKEIFLQFVSPDKKKLYSLLRLRIPYLTPPSCTQGGDWEEVLYKKIPTLKNSAIIREVHTYGKLTAINEKDKHSPQHIGLGKKLLLEAERIARNEFGLKKIAVISGVGVRNYYRKNGYRLKDTYMVKSL